MIRKFLLFAFSLFLFSGIVACSGSKRFTEEGKASYYSNKLQGNKMANGQPYRKGKLTAAHKTLPLGTKIKVTNRQNGKKVKVKITDRGPHTKGRIVDLSLAAAKRLNMVQAGTIPVKIKVVKTMAR